MCYYCNNAYIKKLEAAMANKNTLEFEVEYLSHYLSKKDWQKCVKDAQSDNEVNAYKVMKIVNTLSPHDLNVLIKKTTLPFDQKNIDDKILTERLATDSDIPKDIASLCYSLMNKHGLRKFTNALKEARYNMVKIELQKTKERHRVASLNEFLDIKRGFLNEA